MKTTLSLTDDQTAQMEKAAKEFHKDAHAAKKNGSADKAEFKKIRDKHEANVKTILSEDQFQKWLTFREQNKHEHGRGKRNHKK